LSGNGGPRVPRPQGNRDRDTGDLKPEAEPPQEGPRTMAEKIDEDATVTDNLDRMIEAIVDHMHLDGEDRLKVKIALCEAIAETYSEKAQLLRLLLNEPSGVS
jgi:hypothetical protein